MAELEDEGIQYVGVVVNRPRDIVFVDEFISKITKVVEVEAIHLLTRRDESPVAELEYRLPGAKYEAVEHISFEGETMGHALRSVLDQLAEELDIDKDEI